MRTKRILIADDDDSILFALAKFFEAAGWEVDVAQEWEEAEALLVYRHYDSVISDLHLSFPGDAHGLDVVGSALARNPQARIILITGDPSVEVEFEALRLGALAVLRKPVGLHELAMMAALPSRELQ